MKKLTLLFAVILLTGCTTTTYQEGNAKFTRTSILNKQSVGKVTVKVNPTTGERFFELTAYGHEGQTEVVPMAIEAAKLVK